MNTQCHLPTRAPLRELQLLLHPFKLTPGTTFLHEGVETVVDSIHYVHGVNDFVLHVKTRDGQHLRFTEAMGAVHKVTVIL